MVLPGTLFHLLYSGTQGFILIVVSLLMILFHGSNRSISPERFPFQTTRFLLQIIVLIISLYQLAAAIQTDAISKTISYHEHTSIGLQILGAISLTFFVHIIEKSRRFRFYIICCVWSVNGLAFSCLIIAEEFYATRMEQIYLWNAKNIIRLAATTGFLAVLLLDMATAGITRCFHNFPGSRDVCDPSSFALKHESAHPFSKLTYSWISDTVSLGSKRPLESSDIKHLPKDFLSAHEAASIKRRAAKNKKRSLQSTVILVHWWDLLRIAICLAVSSFSMIATQMCIYGIVSFASHRNASSVHFESGQPSVQEFFSNGFVLSLSLLVMMTLTMLCDNAALLDLSLLGSKLQAGLQVLIFEKILKLNSAVFSTGHASNGRIINMTVADTFNVVKGTITSRVLVKLLIKAVAGTIIMCALIGKAGLVLFAIFAVILVCVALQKLQGTLKTTNLGHADKRLKSTSELMSGMKYFKIQGWDGKFAKKVDAARNFELGSWIKHQAITRITQFILISTSGVLLFLMVLTHTYTSDQALTVSQVVLGLGLVQTLGTEIRSTAMEGHYLVASLVSCIRIGAFLRLPETNIPMGDGISAELVNEMWENIIKESNETIELMNSTRAYGDASENTSLIHNSGKTCTLAVSNRSPSFTAHTVKHEEEEVKSDRPTLSSSNLLIHLENGKFAWDSSDQMGTIMVPYLKVEKKGQLVCIVGASGSGKSMLLASILGELSLQSGFAVINRKEGFAYASQPPWILNVTFRRNIIVDAEFDKEWYEAVVEACTLDRDRALLCDGDETEIGERGVNLSGGQKARLSLARAIYGRNQLVLLDDPLSSLDTKVASTVFQKAVLELLVQQGKTVLLVTHLVQFAAFSDHVIVIDKQEVVEQGKWECLQGKRSLELKAAVVQLQYDKLEDEQQGKAKRILEKPEELQSEYKWKTTEDERLRGVVYWKTFSGLFKVIPWFLPFSVALGLIAVVCLTTAADYYLAGWTYALSIASATNFTHTANILRIDHYYHNYVMLLCLMLAALCYLMTALGVIGYFASRNLHRAMLRSVVAAPMSFFYTNRLGKIMNRFSNDIFFLDHQLSSPIEEFISCALIIIAALVLQMISTPLTGIGIIPFVLATVYLLYYSDPVTRELMRLRNIALSPILNHITESINGIIVIRSMEGKKNRLVQYLKLVDRKNATFMVLHVTFRWMSIRLEALAVCLTFLLAIFGLISVSYEWTEVEVFGLALVYCVQSDALLEQMAYFGLVGTSQINALDRITCFTEIEPEKGRESDRGVTEKAGENNKRKGKSQRFSYSRLGEISEDKPLADDPTMPSDISFREVTLKYQADLPPVVNNVSLTIQPGTRLGVCGRTGSGKSTLVHSLFRVVDIQEGCILKDGVDITTIPLIELRNAMTVVPQDPILLRGSVRYNLDPFHEFEDELLWKAIDICQLREKVADLGDEMAEKGDNLSAGQRQLFCLARALLRRTSVFVLDEVTSCVDFRTDDIIQKILKDHFSFATVIAIAHRVTTLLDYDTVIVMEDGHVIETGSPHDLMSREEGQFRSLVEAAGVSQKKVDTQLRPHAGVNRKHFVSKGVDA